MNAGDAKARRSFGKSVIIGVKVSALRWRHITHLDCIVRNAVLNLTMANFCCIKALRYSTPRWQCFSCRRSRNNRTSGWRLSSKIGCLALKLATSSCFVRPCARRRPFGPKKGEKSFFTEGLQIGEFFSKAFVSLGNDSDCTK